MLKNKLVKSTQIKKQIVLNTSLKTSKVKNKLVKRQSSS